MNQTLDIVWCINMILYILNRQEWESFINNILYKSKIPDSLPDKKMNHRQPDGCFLNIWFIDLMININNKLFISNLIFKFKFQIPTVKHCKLQTYLSNVQQLVYVSNAHLSWHLDKCDNQWQLKDPANKSGGCRPQSVPIPWWWHDDTTTRAGNGASRRFKFYI